MTPDASREPLYLTSMEAAYLRTFEAEVVATPPEGVVLSQSLFYAVGGGQEADHGRLTLPDGKEVRVVDVRRMARRVVHRLEKGGASRFQVGMHVRGEIDWPRRYTHMRLHTAQHLLSALSFERYGLRTTEAAMSGNGGHIDMDGPFPNPSAPATLERMANETYFERPVPVRMQMVTRGEFEALPGRSSAKGLPPGITQVRLILIEGIDRCPCGGTHVKSTDEVRSLRILPQSSASPLPNRMAFELVD